MPRFVWQGKIPLVPPFLSIKEIAMKVSTMKMLIICEDKEIAEASCNMTFITQYISSTHTH